MWVNYAGKSDDNRACPPRRVRRVWTALATLAVLLAAVAGRAAESPDSVKPKNREQAIRALCDHLGIGPGDCVADIGAGKGADTWTFADVVGRGGAVYAEEVGKGMVDRLEEEANNRDLPQVHAVLGKNDDPELPESTCDLAYMHFVYHHFSQPGDMLRGIRRGLKPGGYLVIVDRHKGTLRDWVPRQQRREKHFWIAETTVVREAREEGFAFVGCAEDRWNEKDPFVLVFQRPKGSSEPGRDPDPFLPLDVDALARQLAPQDGKYQRPVFIALGEGRKVIAPMLAQSSGRGLDIVLEEWATQKDERPPLPEGVSLPSALTEKGDPQLGDKPIDAVFFLDTYHLLFHGKTLLAKLHENLTLDARVYILDRKAKQALSRREASHHRQISPETVREEMKAAGFTLLSEEPPPAADRFLLVFGKAPPNAE